MAISSRSVNYAVEVDAVLQIASDLIVSIKAGKSILDIGAAELPALIAAVGNIAQVQAELQANRQVVLETAGYQLGNLVNAILG